MFVNQPVRYRKKAMQKLTRRNFISLASSVTGAFVISSCTPNGMMGPMMPPYAESEQILLTPAIVGRESDVESNTVDQNFAADLELNLRAVVTTFNFTADVDTPILRYVGELIKGEPNSFTEMANSFLGPTIRVKRGQRVRIHLINELAISMSSLARSSPTSFPQQ